MEQVIDVICRKLGAHSTLSDDIMMALQALTPQLKALRPRQDIVRQGDRPAVSVVVMSGMLARYHTLGSGRRQYLSFHITGDMPDAQTLHVERMDHAVCAIDEATVALLPHDELHDLIERFPDFGAAVWRETLIDAAIFREAITNNSARQPRARTAHFFCEQYYRARAGKHARPGVCRLPINQTQLGEALGISVVTANRAVQSLRASKAVEWSDGQLRVFDWRRLAELGEFDPTYLHLKRPPRL